MVSLDDRLLRPRLRESVAERKRAVHPSTRAAWWLLPVERGEYGGNDGHTAAVDTHTTENGGSQQRARERGGGRRVFAIS